MARTKHKKRIVAKLLIIILCVIICLLVAAIFRFNRNGDIIRTGYKQENFYYDNDFLKYKGKCSVGIDVSSFQKDIDWEKVANCGVEFVIIRCGFRGLTEGNLFYDDQFEEYYKGAKAAGIQIGCYFFSQATNVEEAIEEAEFCVDLLKNHEIDLPIFYDWEISTGSSRLTSAKDIPVTECALQFCKVLTNNGYDAGVYFNKSQSMTIYNLERLKRYSFWLAEYKTFPTYGKHFDIVQYNCKGNIDGIDVNVDLNLWIQ